MEQQLAKQNDQLQMMPIQEAQAWYNDFVAFSKSILKKDLDYGIIPGTPKPTLYKAGAEKLRFAYGLGIEFETIENRVDLEKPFVDYTYRCSVRTRHGQVIAQCEGNCNSTEAKFGYLWLPITELPEGTDISKLRTKTSGKKLTEFEFAIEKAETTGTYGKPAEYWQKFKDAIDNGTAKHFMKKTSKGRDMPAWELNEQQTLYRITNPDVVGLKNTIMKMAQKRAFVGAMLLATGASEFYTQDIEDMEMFADVVAPPQKGFIEELSYEEAAGGESEQATPTGIEGSWHAKLERCKTPADVDKLAMENRTAIEANPALRKLFNETKHSLKQVAHA